MKPLLLLLISGIILTSCTVNSALVKKAQTPETSGRYTAVKPELSPRKGFADLTVIASLKTHVAGSFDTHGTAGYRLLVNLDGEPLKLTGTRQQESDDTLPENHPEAGDGIRYRFSTHLRLDSGLHKIIVSLPDDNIAVQCEIRLEDMTDSVLELRPSYYSDWKRIKRGNSGGMNFKNGISGFDLFLDGKQI